MGRFDELQVGQGCRLAVGVGAVAAAATAAATAAAHITLVGGHGDGGCIAGIGGHSPAAAGKVVGCSALYIGEDVGCIVPHTGGSGGSSSHGAAADSKINLGAACAFHVEVVAVALGLDIDHAAGVAGGIIGPRFGRQVAVIVQEIGRCVKEQRIGLAGRKCAAGSIAVSVLGGSLFGILGGSLLGVLSGSLLGVLSGSLFDFLGRRLSGFLRGSLRGSLFGFLGRSLGGLFRRSLGRFCRSFRLGGSLGRSGFGLNGLGLFDLDDGLVVGKRNSAAYEGEHHRKDEQET